MSTNIITLPYSYFPDPDQGRPLFNADIYVGEPDTDPQIPINQKPVQLRLENGTVVPVLQPVNTGDGGVILYNGSPAQLLVDGNFSLKVLSSKQVQKYYVADYEGSVLTPFDLIKFYQTSNTLDLDDGRTKLVLVNPPSLAPRDYFVTFNNAIKEPDTEYTINTSGEMIFSPAVEADIDSIIIRAAVYGQGVSQTTIDKLATARIGGSFKDNELVPLAAGLDLSTVTAAFNESSNLSLNLSNETGVVTDIPTDFAESGQLEIDSVIRQMRRASPQVQAEIFVEAYAFGSDYESEDFDWAPVWRSAVKDIVRSGKVTRLKSGRSKYKFKTPEVVPAGNPAAGKNVALWIERADLVSIQGNGAILFLDGQSPAVAGLDDMISVSRAVDEQAFVNWQDVTFDGGTWDDINDEPDYTLRMDYNVLKYSNFTNVKVRRSRITNWLACGFVNTVLHCDCREASEFANMSLVTESVAGGTGARTGWMIHNTTFDFAGLHGLSITGGSGHTYMSIGNNTADHIGRDRDNNTIEANIPTATAYNLSGVFSSSLVDCGVEFSTRMLTLSSCKGIYFKLYGNANGSTIPEPVPELVKISGFCERISYDGFEENATINVTDVMSVSTPVGVNRVALSNPDRSIALSQMRFDGGTKTSENSLLYQNSDMYRVGMLCPEGGAVVAGKPLFGNIIEDYANQFNYEHTHSFKFVTDGAGLDTYVILTLDDVNTEAYAAFTVTAEVGKSSGGAPSFPRTYVGTAAAEAGNQILEDFTPLFGSDLYPTVELYWSGPDLRVRTSELFCTHLITFKTTTRTSVGEMTYTTRGETP